MEMELSVEKLHLGSDASNRVKPANPTHYQHSGQSPKPPPTLHHKVARKNEIIITSQQLRETKWLFRQYGLQKPGWVRTRFINNQRRRKALNDILVEAGLDYRCCGPPVGSDWAGQLHTLWHQINGGQSCK